MKILTALLTLLCCVSGIAQDDLNPAVLLVSDNIQQDNILAGAAGKDVLVIRYKTKTTDLNGLLSLVSKKLDGKLASSIGIAAHDYGEAKFYLTDSETISLQSTLNNLKQREFWKELGQLIAENGRIDLLVCNLARGNQGEMLIASLENLTKVQVAASSNETGNPLKGGDWVMETANLDISKYYFDQNKLKRFSGLLWAQRKKIEPGDPGGDTLFGGHVCIAGDLAIIGAPNDDDNGNQAGSAYIFSRNHGGANNWGQVTKLMASDGSDIDHFGGSVAIYGDYAIVGAFGDDDLGYSTGAVYLFFRNQGGTDNWGEVKKLIPFDNAAGDLLGNAVALSGDYALVGAYGKESFQGAAYVFSRNEGGPDNWGEVQKLTGDNRHFGCSLALSGNSALVGQQHFIFGAALVFDKDEGGIDNWGRVKKITVADGGATKFGMHVAISGDFALIGAHQDNDIAPHAGAGYIFSRNQGGANNWGQLKKLTVSDGQDSDYLGYSVAISGETAIVGAEYDDDNGTTSGSAYVFSRNLGGSDNWGMLQKRTALDAAASDHFASDVSISGNYAIIGAHWESSRGSAYIFQPEFHVVVNSTANGNTDKTGDNVVFPGQSISITANPGTGYVFASWSGDASGSTNPLTINNVQTDYSITPVFTRTYGTLNVNLSASTSGATYSISGPSDFNGGNPLSGQTANFSQVVPTGNYTATFSQDIRYNFSASAPSFTVNNYSVSGTLGANTTETISGTYVRATATLNVNISADASGASYSISGPPDFNGGNPLTGQTANFSQVVPTGDYAVTFLEPISHNFNANATSFTVSGYTVSGALTNAATETVSGTYNIKQYSITVGAAALGHSNHDGVTTVDYGGSLSITAIPDYGASFQSWSGDFNSSTNPLAITNITQDYSLTPIFSNRIGSLRVNLTGTDDGRWRIAGKSRWLRSREIQHDLHFGDVTVECLPIPGFRKPHNKTVRIREEGIREVTLDYNIFTDPPIMHYFTATPEEVAKGGKVTLAWEAEGSSKVIITPHLGEIGKDIGSTQVVVDKTTTFTMKAKNSDRTSAAATTVTIAPKLEILKFAADRKLVHKGDNLTITWLTGGAEKIALLDKTTKAKTELESQGSLVVTPEITTNYQLTATDAGGKSTSGKLKVKVTEDPVVNYFRTSTDSACPGKPATLSWEVAGADSVDIQPGIGQAEAIGEMVVTPMETTTYTLTARGNGTDKLASTKITAVSKAPDLKLSFVGITSNGEEVKKPAVGEQTAISLTLENLGNVTARNVKVALESEGGSCCCQVISKIAPGEKLQISFDWCAHQRGKHVLNLAADPANAIGELDETNNLVTRSIRTAAVDGIDLLADNINVELADDGKTARVRFTILNAGNKASGSFQYQVFLTKNGKQKLTKALALVADDHIDSLAPGEKVTLTRTVKLSKATKKLYLQGLVDIHEAIVEVNKENNHVVRRVK